MSLEQAVSTLQQEVAQLKKDLADKRGIAGPTGPRGGAGDITAAVNNARQVATEVATEAAKRAVIYPFEAKNAKLRAEFADLKADFQRLEENMEHAIFCRTVEALQEYGVLDEKMQPINAAFLNSHLKSIGLLKS